ncbi:hypothetical protein CRE_08524 [Caenorhabditis remanei]|uniref:Uncharacterized protein n=1 Tax=Caenorhabditis remanei TaxID=31234 RepID=E3N6X5_CAERE|nr:hypothetical protein CRE_08524 [Caenorhabditis remanei]
MGQVQQRNLRADKRKRRAYESEREKEVSQQTDDDSEQEEVEVRVTRSMYKKMKLELENRRRVIKMLAQQQKMESEQPSERKQDVPSSSAVIGIEGANHSNQEREQNEDLHNTSFTIDELEAVDAYLYHVMETVLRQTHVDLPTEKVEYFHDPLEDHKNYFRFGPITKEEHDFNEMARKEEEMDLDIIILPTPPRNTSPQKIQREVLKVKNVNVSNVERRSDTLPADLSLRSEKKKVQQHKGKPISVPSVIEIDGDSENKNHAIEMDMDIIILPTPPPKIVQQEVKAEVQQMEVLNPLNDEHEMHTVPVETSQTVEEKKVPERIRELIPDPPVGIINFENKFGKEVLTTADFLGVSHPNWFSGSTIKFCAAEMMDNLQEVDRVLMFDFILDNIGRTIFVNCHLPYTQQILDELQQRCEITLGARKKLCRTDNFKKDMWCCPYFIEFHFMLIVVRNPFGAILDGSEENKSPCIVLFLDPMGDIIEYRGQRVLRMVKVFMKCYFQALQRSRKYPETAVFDENRVVLKRVKNLPLQSNLIDCGPSVVSYLETILDNQRGLLKRNVEEDLDWNTLELNGNNSIDVSRSKVRARMLRRVSSETRDRLSRMEAWKNEEYVSTYDKDPLYMKEPSTRRSRSSELKQKSRKPYKRNISADFVANKNPRELQRQITLRAVRNLDEQNTFSNLPIVSTYH